MATPANPRSPDTIVLVHGMWMTPRSWQGWIDRYTRAGYRVLAPAWPGLEGEVEAIRRDPTPLIGLGAAEIVEHYEEIIRELDSEPILIGHSFGGAFVQVLLDRGAGAAGVAIHATPVRQAVYTLPASTLAATWRFLIKPWNARRALPFTPAQFHHAFANTLDEDASNEAYDRLHIPAPGRALFQGALANFERHSPFAIDFANRERAPLLFIAGTADRLMPPSVQRRSQEHYLRAGAQADLIEFADRSHFTIGEPGWEEVADRALAWAVEHARRGPEPRPTEPGIVIPIEQRGTSRTPL
ncbi:MAG: alpha/beta hydrolase [Kofleriaceae bacterium]